MASLQPPQITPVSQAPDDPRLGTLLGQDIRSPGTAKVVLVGFPTDEGVRRNGGRVGAAQAPDAIRQALFKLTPDPQRFVAFVDLLRHTADLGNLVTTEDLEGDQAALGQILAPHLARGAVAIILGGGHETAYGHFLGYAQRRRKVAILNWDAHADVRPRKDGLGHSGSPFRQALMHESGCCRGYTVAGLQPTSVAKAHLDFITQHGGRFFFHQQLDRRAIADLYAEMAGDTLVTLDMDAVDQAFALGVSAPTAGGLSLGLWLRAVRQAGKCPHVRSLDLVEVNPSLDVDARTVRLAALTVWRFLQGLVDRPAAHFPAL